MKNLRKVHVSTTLQEKGISAFDPTNHPFLPVPNHFGQTLILQPFDNLRKLGRINLDAALFPQHPHRIRPLDPSRPSSPIQNAQHPLPHIIPQLPLTLPSPRVQQPNINLPCSRIHRARPDRLPHQPTRFLHIAQLHKFRETHPRMGLREPDHAFELSSRRRDPLLTRARVVAHVAHFDVRFDELCAGLFGDDRMDL